MVSQSLTISNQLPSHAGQHLDKLRQQGIERLQVLAPNTWTDHNRFDPGITLLEILVFVLSDLSYKLSFPVPDLLRNNTYPSSNQFLPPQAVLFSHCVTLDDYRRLILDLPAVKNVHVTVAKGTLSHAVELDFNVLLYVQDPALEAQVAEQIQQAFADSRCVNHTLGAIRFYQSKGVKIGMELTLHHVTDLVTTLTDIFLRIGDEISPEVPKYSAQQLLDLGLSIDEIYQGPRVHNGFALAQDLARSAYSAHVFASDILSVIDGHENIALVRSFRFIDEDSTQQGYQYWQTEVDSGSDNDNVFSPRVLPKLAFEDADFFSALRLIIDDQTYTLSKQEQAEIRAGLSALNSSRKTPSSPYLPLPSLGNELALSQYEALQHEFPQVYALSEQSLNSVIDTPQKAQLMQFKGYLQLFEQVLADQHKQLDVLPYILSLPQPKVFEPLGLLLDSMLASESLSEAQCRAFWQGVRLLAHSQLSQAVSGISGIEQLLDTKTLRYWQRGMQDQLEADFSIAQLTRLNHSAAHLLARFGASAVDPNILKYKAVFSFYESSLASSNLDPSHSESLLVRLVLLRQYIDKCRLLCAMGSLGEHRCRGYDFLSRIPQRAQLSSFAEGIMRRLGLSHPGEMPLATNNRESFYLVEGNQLKTADQTIAAQLNNALYFVFPEWTSRFNNQEFREFVARTCRDAAPLHMPVRCIWLDREAMSLFERSYYGWLNFYGQQQRTRFANQKDAIVATTKLLGQLLGSVFCTSEALLSEHPRKVLVAAILNLVFKQEANWTAIKKEVMQILQTYSKQKLPKDLVLLGDSLESISIELGTLLNTHSELFPQGFSADTALYLTAQHLLDELTRPSILDTRNQKQRFTVGYTPLSYLKPIFPLSISKINPGRYLASQFIVANSVPHRI